MAFKNPSEEWSIKYVYTGCSILADIGAVVSELVPSHRESEYLSTSLHKSNLHDKKSNLHDELFGMGDSTSCTTDLRSYGKLNLNYLTKAFDTVNHSILSRKLSRFGVDDTAQNWFDSFLSNRNQVTCRGRAQSDPDIVSVGVAQGSILGPLLFIIYMNDLPNVLESCSVTLYADDTVLYFSSKLISEIETKMNSDLRQVCNWFKLNQLTLNIKKSQFMLIGSNSRLRRIDSIVISADGKQLMEAQYFPVVKARKLSYSSLFLWF